MDYDSAIAVVGIGCRLAGGAHGTEKLWSILEDGHNTWSDVPEDRFTWTSFDQPSHDAISGFRHRGGHFLEGDVATFDAEFFGISALEAQAMDPQQRHALEVAYEAFENAGIPLQSLKGTDTGVYIATFNHDYENLVYKDTISVPKYSMTGVGQAIVSNRISYLFDLRGPSITIDTGCSGSLVALHQACQSLQLGESNCALVGGTNLILSPDTMMPMHKLHFLNASGRSFSFDEMGSGYGRGEGVAMLVLKPLRYALKDNDTIRGIVRGTAVGQDGRTNGITLPSADAQQSLIRSAYRNAGLDPAATAYVEAHGTGTAKGDLAEIQALHAVFGKGSLGHDPVLVGSLKANFGHTEASSGLAGVIKAILVLEKNIIPGTPTVQNLRQSLQSYSDTISITNSNQSWPSKAARRVSVNSFGYGGTNAHAIIDGATMFKAKLANKSSAASSLRRSTQRPRNASEDFATSWLSYDRLSDDSGSTADQSPSYCDFSSSDSSEVQSCSSTTLSQNATPRSSTELDTCKESHRTLESDSSKLFILTAKTKQSLEQNIAQLQKWVQHHNLDSTSLYNLAHTLCNRRSLMQWRYAFVCSDKAELSTSLHPLPRPCSRATDNHETVFVFTGQGSQWYAMGRELLGNQCFESSLRESDRVLRGLGCSWDTFEELLRDEKSSRVSMSAIGQPLATAIQIALVQLLRYVGIHPDFVLGHSSGEIAAAFAAGAIDHASAMKVAYYRGFVADRCRKIIGCKGAMMAVGIGEETVAPLLAQITEGKAVVACRNSALSITVSGDLTAIEQLETILKTSMPDVFVKRLKVDTAYHSHHVHCVAEKYQEVLDGIESSKPNPAIKFISSVTGQVKLGGFGASYWVQNLTSKVDFLSGMETLCHEWMIKYPKTKSKVTSGFIEIGPAKALSSYVQETVTQMCGESFNLSIQSMLIRGQNAHRTVLEALGQWLQVGGQVDTTLLNNLVNAQSLIKASVVTDLPSYSWDHSRSFWSNSQVSKQHLFRAHPYHDLCGIRSPHDTLLEPKWRHRISQESTPWLKDYLVDGIMVFPAAGFITMVIQAKTQISQARFGDTGIASYCLEQISFSRPLQVPDLEDGLELQLSLTTLDPEAEMTFSLWEEFRISSIQANGVTTHHCRGRIRVESTTPEENDTPTLSHIRPLTTPAQPPPSHHLEKVRHQAWSPMAIYKAEERRGHYRGVSFARIHQIDAGELDATGTISVANLGELMLRDASQPHVIHPTTLDSLIHSALLLFRRNCNASTISPALIGQLVVRSDIARRPGDSLRFFSQIDPAKNDETIMAVDCLGGGKSHNSELYLSIRDGHVRVANRTEANEADKAECLSAYEVQWRTDIDQVSYNHSHKIGLRDAELDYKASQMTQQLNDATIDLMRKTLSRLSDSEIKPQHNEYFHWMEDLVNESHTEPYVDREVPFDKSSIEMEVLAVLDDNLEFILRGGAEAASVYLDHKLFKRLYFEDWSAKKCSQGLLNFISLSVFKEPGIKVLEIGAGTGGATLPLLNAISPPGSNFVSQYDFTDISAAFFEHAKGLLQEWSPIMRYETLDISKDPATQHFEENDYDLIIAYNALHVTRSVDEAIANAGKLLKPGGRLALLEMTTLHPFINAIFGLLPGWYMQRTDGRQGPPLLSCEQWNDRLQKQGFSSLEYLEHDFEGIAQRTSVMVARKASIDMTEIAVPKLHLLLQTGRDNLYMEFQKALSGHFPLTTPSSHVEQSVFSGGLAIDVFSLEENLAGDNASPNKATGMVWVTPYPERMIPDCLWSQVENQRANGKDFPIITVHMTKQSSEEQLKSAAIFSNMIIRSFGKNITSTTLETCYHIAADRVQIPRLIPLKTIDNELRATQPDLSMNSSASSTYIVTSRDTDFLIRACNLLDSIGASHIAILPDKSLSISEEYFLTGEIYIRNLSANVAILKSSSLNSLIQNVPAQMQDWPAIRGVFALDSDKDLQQLAATVGLDFIFSLSSFDDPSTERDLSCFYEYQATVPPVCLSMHLASQTKLDWSTISFVQFRNTIGSALIKTLRSQSSRQVLICADQNLHSMPRFALGVHLPKIEVDQEPVDVETEIEPVAEEVLEERSLEDAVSVQDALAIIESELLEKLVSLISIDTDNDALNSMMAIEDLGLDSFMRFRLRNWIFGTFKAALEPDEIAVAPSVTFLVDQILQRTTLTEWKPESTKPSDHQVDDLESLSEPRPEDGEFPQQPLPTIQDTLQTYLNAVRPFCTPDELARTEREVQKFQAPDSLAHTLQQRLQSLVDDPDTENWLSDLYTDRRWLAVRSSLVAQHTYFGTHPFGPSEQSQSERAALLTLAACGFKGKMQNGTLPMQFLAGKAIDPASYRWFFNTCREPHIGQDRLKQYDLQSNHHIIVMRQGNVFKVEVKHDGNPASFQLLKALFEHISELPLTMSHPGILTADQRNTWAKNRVELMQHDPANTSSISVIESAAFVVCLDEESPDTPVERFRQFSFTNCSNRWYDKTLQFVVCKNGASASLIEHAAIDGVATLPLHEAINEVIRGYRGGELRDSQVWEPVMSTNITPITFQFPQTISTQVQPLRESFKEKFNRCTFDHLSLKSLLPAIISEQKLPLQSTMQLALQLAARRFYDCILPASETVNLGHFRGGRVDVNAIMQISMVNFLESCIQDVTPTMALRKLAVEATREHIRSLTRVHMGRGYNRHLLAMQWMIDSNNPQEPMPSFFLDPSYAKSQPGKILTTTFEDNWVEGGFVYLIPDSILVQFKAGEDEVQYSIFGNGRDANSFARELVRASEEVRQIITFKG